MADIVRPNAQQPITEVDDRAGIMQQVFRFWVNAVTRDVNFLTEKEETLGLVIGTGAPEDVVSAIQGRQYMDQAAAPGSLLYMKQVDDIAGDDKKGWVLIG